MGCPCSGDAADLGLPLDPPEGYNVTVAAPLCGAQLLASFNVLSSFDHNGEMQIIPEITNVGSNAVSLDGLIQPFSFSRDVRLPGGEWVVAPPEEFVSVCW